MHSSGLQRDRIKNCKKLQSHLAESSNLCPESSLYPAMTAGTQKTYDEKNIERGNVRVHIFFASLHHASGICIPYQCAESLLRMFYGFHPSKRVIKKFKQQQQ
jgi:hypothetical protein